MANYVWLDCDPGIDDAFAILMACFSNHINLIGISTVCGNQTIEKVTLNALKCLNMFNQISEPTLGESKLDFSKKLTTNDCLTHGGMNFPLVQGCAKPLLRSVKIGAEIHGETGLDTLTPVKFPEIPENAKKYVANLNQQETHFTTLIYQHIKQQPTPITFIATGPMTNLALLFINYPDSYKYINKIVVMGGSMTRGNKTPMAEFNIHVDPEAASYVFHSELIPPIYMIPLDVTHTVNVTSEVINSIRSIKSEMRNILVELLLFYKSTVNSLYSGGDTHMHDACTVAFMNDPEMFQFSFMRVDVECSSSLSYGQTVCDLYHRTDLKSNVYVCTKMNTVKFWSMFLDAVKHCDLVSPANKNRN